jgi:hypothetical protein
LFAFYTDLASSSGKPCYVVTPETLVVCHDGEIRVSSLPSFSDVVSSSQNTFIAPECFLGITLTREAMEKVKCCILVNESLNCSHVLVESSQTLSS